MRPVCIYTHERDDPKFCIVVCIEVEVALTPNPFLTYQESENGKNRPILDLKFVTFHTKLTHRTCSSTSILTTYLGSLDPPLMIEKVCRSL